MVSRASPQELPGCCEILLKLSMFCALAIGTFNTLANLRTWLVKGINKTRLVYHVMKGNM
jgi:hypothetical protein